MSVLKFLVVNNLYWTLKLPAYGLQRIGKGFL